MMLTSGKQATYEYDLYDKKSVCLSARCKIDTHTEFNSCKRQAAAKTTKYSSTRITTLVFRTLLYFYLLLFHKHTRSFSSFLIYNTIIFHTFFRSLSLSLSRSLSLSLSLPSLTLFLHLDRNHITNSQISHTRSRMSTVIRAQLHIRDEKSSQHIATTQL